MTEEKITIKIDENGEMKIKTQGILGPTCVDEVDKLLKDIALTVNYTKTDEYYMKPQRITQTQSEVSLKRE